MFTFTLELGDEQNIYDKIGNLLTSIRYDASNNSTTNTYSYWAQSGASVFHSCLLSSILAPLWRKNKGGACGWGSCAVIRC